MAPSNNDATVFDGITVPLIWFGVARDEKSPLLATTFQICESILEQGDELVIFEMSSFGEIGRASCRERVYVLV